MIVARSATIVNIRGENELVSFGFTGEFTPSVERGGRGGGEFHVVRCDDDSRSRAAGLYTSILRRGVPNYTALCDGKTGSEGEFVKRW